VLRRREGTRFSSPSDDEVGGCHARSARSEPVERSNETRIARAAVLRRREGTRFSSPSDDEVGGCHARSARSEPVERSNEMANLIDGPGVAAVDDGLEGVVIIAQAGREGHLLAGLVIVGLCLDVAEDANRRAM
jgi:hypothetical protein